MRWVVDVARMGKIKITCHVLWGELKEIYNMEVLCIDGRILLG
jgi:hypothetical protein